MKNIINILLSLVAFYLLYIGLYFVGDIVGGIIYTEVKSSYLLAIPPAVLCFAYLFTLSHIFIIKHTKINRYVYIICQFIMLAWFSYLKINTYIDYKQFDTSSMGEVLNDFTFCIEMVLSAIGVVLTLFVSYFFEGNQSNTIIANENTKRNVTTYTLGAIFVIGAICLVLVSIILIWNSKNFWTSLLSGVLIMLVIPEIIGILYGLAILYLSAIERLVGKKKS